MRNRAWRSPGLAIAMALVCAAADAPARDVYVLLSGGADPWSNNHSQYLQARAVAEHFRRRHPADSVWTFFGAGNAAGARPVFGDVLRRVREDDGLLVDTWLPGVLPGNRPARREEILRAFREEILPAVSDGGTLFLFVGDHGSETGGDEPESVIDLWGIRPDPGSARGWAEDRTQKLRVGELRDVLREGLGRGRVVFCMTQCHSGGFHDLGAGREPSPPADWFTARPEWLSAAADTAPLPAVAGFTATDAASPAAGCDPSPDPDTWAGYERYLPEQLFGLDLFTLQPAGRRRASFFEAHVEATLADATIDRPRSTSEHWLARWADLIEARLAAEKLATPRLRAAVEAYDRAVDTGRATVRDAALEERRALFARFERRLFEQLGEDGAEFRHATRRVLEDAIEDAEDEDADGPVAQAAEAPPPAPRGGRGERRRAWSETVRPAWRAAVAAGTIEGLAGAAREFELHLLAQEEEGRRLTVGRRAADNLVEEVFWESGYHDPATIDPARARAVARWGAERRWRIAEWTRALPAGGLRAAAERVFPEIAAGDDTGAAPEEPQTGGGPRLAPATAAARILFHRRVLAAWEFLLAMEAAPALEEVARLTALERTPLPER